ncbi:acyl-CoA dehydrogenase family member 10-like isoform X4 [Saccostrea cucullata]|uniref:acyl-CoA dehydrogenase family member 10-like isoform X4 n=1 Tax=Saccostrea cuccullata TaxID=36930 RepID=UPI002ED3908F
MHRFPLSVLRAPKLSQSVSSQILSPRIQASVVMAQHRPKTTKAVIFDLGGVVVPSPLAAFQEYEKKLGLPRGSISGAVVESGDNGAWNRLERGEISLSEFADKFSEEVSKKAGKRADMSGLMKFIGNSLMKPNQSIIDAVKSLKIEGLKTALLTNNWHWEGEGPNRVMDRDLFDVIVESSKVGARKPERRIYEICLEQLDVRAEESVFLDDLGVNLKAAKALGIRTIKVTDPTKAVLDLEQEVGGLCLRRFVDDTTTVPEHLRIPMDRLETYFNQQLNLHSPEPPVIRCFRHGQSNPTYYVYYAGKHLVLRKKPPGKLLPSAHAVEREFRVMKAVGQWGVPIPRMYGLCEDSSVIGTPFYVMEYCKGRIFKDLDLPGMTNQERRDIYIAMADTLCKIHRVDISKAGLDDYGKKGGYLRRNLNRWTKQYEASKTEEIPAMNKLIDWLSQHLPEKEAVTIAHGDFRLDNLIFHPTKPEVIGVLDWELSTIGDPITDLSTCLLNYYLPANFPMIRSLKETDVKSLGIPTVEEFIDIYCQRMGIPAISNFDFYVAFGLFRFAAIIQGVYKRAISGQGSAPNSVLVGEFAKLIAELGCEIASSSNLQPTVSPIGGGIQTENMSGKRNYSIGTAGTANQMVVSPEGLSPRAKDLYDRVKDFIEKEVKPAEKEILEFYKPEQNHWRVCPVILRLKEKAKAAGLWNLYLPKESDPGMKYGAGLSNLEYAFMCEEMGKYPLSSEVFNCQAPDTGNMEVLVRYGTEEQKRQWLTPLLNGEIKSCFGMTEPQVASSDATNIESSITREGDHYVINGHKWWTSGALHPDCKVCVFMGKTDKSAATHRQQSMILVPMDAPGVKIVRPLTVFGYLDYPAGHAEVIFENVKVPLGNMLLGEGRGFEIAQGRLGPGRIHHCMRLIGNAERALQLMLERTQNRVAFGKPLAAQGTIQQDVAKSRIEIEQTRLLVLKAAHMMDNYGNKVAAPEIAMIKVAAPNMALNVIDRAIQAHGGAGLSDDFILAGLFSWARVLRLADGPDEVHLRSVSRQEYRKYNLSKL